MLFFSLVVALVFFADAHRATLKDRLHATDSVVLHFRAVDAVNPLAVPAVSKEATLQLEHGGGQYLAELSLPDWPGYIAVQDLWERGGDGRLTSIEVRVTSPKAASFAEGCRLKLWEGISAPLEPQCDLTLGKEKTTAPTTPWTWPTESEVLCMRGPRGETIRYVRKREAGAEGTASVTNGPNWWNIEFPGCSVLITINVEAAGKR